eukprot:CAMPEP_0178455968 /NCGR_PEP_ID=MMETSP0689_2-20121128/46199_1 /TAXON_ID=160604 /ORGANISM="Amphidinium massartii, Strain CS-259" /LENGTH=90 /DNA_ID=CAMNT_0020082053 /DNA_START=109 /DNA_END=380 /DNA_ORIENTATION=-
MCDYALPTRRHEEAVVLQHVSIQVADTLANIWKVKDTAELDVNASAIVSLSDGGKGLQAMLPQYPPAAAMASNHLLATLATPAAHDVALH